MSMRGIYTSVNDIRKRVFAEVARLSYNYQPGDLSEMEMIPYRILPGEISTYRDSIFLERAIVKERMRLAMGLNLRTAAEHAPVSTGAEECVKPEKYYEPPLINIIKFACHACTDNQVVVSDQCQGCLAHPCKEICPRQAITIKNHRAEIDPDKCIKCKRCIDVCQFKAIIHRERPCAKACGMNAIHSDEYGRAEIDQNKCVSCGMCLANCPFGAIADKAQIFQAIQALRDPNIPVYAAFAPAVVGQFGPKLPMSKIRSAFQALGFTDVAEVAIGADLCILEEAEDFVKNVPEKLPFLGTSCCPSWSVMAKKEFPEFADRISMALTPMVLTGRLTKKQHPGCKVAFIGPCSAKKLEASRRTIRSDIDFVLTFEEVMGMFEAREVDFDALEEDENPQFASGDGRGFAISGGVAGAVAGCVKRWRPDLGEIPIERAETLADCRKLLQRAKAGQLNGYLLEGMACPGGCVGGAGTVQPINKSTAAIQKIKRESAKQHADDDEYGYALPELEKE